MDSNQPDPSQDIECTQHDFTAFKQVMRIMHEMLGNVHIDMIFECNHKYPTKYRILITQLDPTKSVCVRVSLVSTGQLFLNWFDTKRTFNINLSEFVEALNKLDPTIPLYICTKRPNGMMYVSNLYSNNEHRVQTYQQTEPSIPIPVQNFALKVTLKSADMLGILSAANEINNGSILKITLTDSQIQFQARTYQQFIQFHHDEQIDGEPVMISNSYRTSDLCKLFQTGTEVCPYMELYMKENSLLLIKMDTQVGIMYVFFTPYVAPETKELSGSE